jgi:hypothetical protein
VKEVRMRKSFLVSLGVQAVLLAAFLVVPGAIASTVTIPHTFVGGTTALASEVNANFQAVKAAVDDNDARIAVLEDASVFGDVETLDSFRGVVAADGTILSGGGFTVTKGAAGQYTLDFDVPFFDAPAVLLTDHQAPSPTYRNPFVLTGSSVSFTTRDAGGVGVDVGFSVYVIGIR